MLLELLRLPEKKIPLDVDSPGAAEMNRQIIRRKPFLKKLYTDWYREFCSDADGLRDGLLVELGSGGGFLKDVDPRVITSDIVFLPGIDLNFSVFHMPFKDDSVRAFFMLDVLHHIKEPEDFFKELGRCLKVDGRIVMIEPANTIWSRFVYRYFHNERFDASGPWRLEGNGPLSSANGAMPWIIFFRDKGKFKDRFPLLKVKNIRIHTPLRYLISGGLSIRQLAPSCMYSVIKWLEIMLSPLNRLTGMFLTIRIKKGAA